MKIFYHKKFEKRLKKLSISEKKLLAGKIELFANDPFNETLRNHPLHGKYKTYRSINIGGDLSALYMEFAPGIIQFRYLGTHHELYGS